MGYKNQFPITFNWQSTSPVTGFLPVKFPTGSAPSGVINGVMTGATTIYSQILNLQGYDNMGLEVAWTGTPTGTLSVLASNSGINFPALTFNPALAQPSGSASSYLINLNQLPFKYLLFQYVNASGAGVLNIFGQAKGIGN